MTASWVRGKHSLLRRRSSPARSHAPSRRFSDPPLPRPCPTFPPAFSLRLFPARPDTRGRSANVETSRVPKTAFHSYISGCGLSLTTPGQLSNTSQVQLRGSSVSKPILELHSFELTKCGRYLGRPTG